MGNKCDHLRTQVLCNVQCTQNLETGDELAGVKETKTGHVWGKVILHDMKYIYHLEHQNVL